MYELNNHSVIATLRGAHTSCIGAAAFLPLGAERCVATGALDCTMATHDATTGRAKRTWDLRRGGGDAGDQQQIFNPPMVHAMATRAAGGGAPALCAQPHARLVTCIRRALKCLAGDLCTLAHSLWSCFASAHAAAHALTSAAFAAVHTQRHARRLAAARGDGCVSIFDAEAAAAAATPPSKGRSKQGRSATAAAQSSLLEPCAGVVVLGAGERVHCAAVGALAFMAPPLSHVLVSAGNDRQIALWRAPAGGGADAGRGALCALRHGRKANAVAAFGARAAGAFAVADTSRRVAVYSVHA